MKHIVLSPFSNSSIRDWPARRYAELAALLVRHWPEGLIRITGTRNQWIAACGIVRHLPADRVVNECGRMSWNELVASVRTASCVVGNNSGICHLSGHLGVPTVSVFGGSHSRWEWRPLGPNVIVVTRAIGCSPCQLDHNAVSPYRKACLREIEAEDVMKAVFLAMKGEPLAAAAIGSNW